MFTIRYVGKFLTFISGKEAKKKTDINKAAVTAEKAAAVTSAAKLIKAAKPKKKEKVGCALFLWLAFWIELFHQ